MTVAGEKTPLSPFLCQILSPSANPRTGGGLEEGPRLSSPSAPSKPFAFFRPAAGWASGKRKRAGREKRGKAEKKGRNCFPFSARRRIAGGRRGETLFSALLTAEYCLSRGSGGEAFALCPPGKKVRPPFPRGHVSVLRPRVLPGFAPLFFGSGFLRFGKADYNARRKEAERLFPEEGIPAPEVPTQVRLLSLAAAFEENRAAAFCGNFRALSKPCPPCPEEKIRKAGGILRFSPRTVRRGDFGADAGFRTALTGGAGRFGKSAKDKRMRKRP